MYPDETTIGSGVSGIHTVVKSYHRIAKSIGVEFVSGDDEHDVSIVHAGMLNRQADIAMLHGIYFTAEYKAAGWEWMANRNVIQGIMSADIVTVPSEWVAKTIRKDFKIDPYILEHGVFLDDWKTGRDYNPNQVLWGKNRAFEDVCDPTPVTEIARVMPDVTFITTFSSKDAPGNVVTVGLQDTRAMKQLVSSSAAVLSTIKETWGLLYIEAMASGVPVVSVNGGHVPTLVVHGVGGYCYRSGDIDDMKRGIEWVLKNREALSGNARKLASRYTWDKTGKRLRQVLEVALKNKHDKKTRIRN
jgi:glycosyltransferase involved in cell wall biosynthesis